MAYALQLFFDFAGYSAMTIGLALMCGFRFPENFDHPYLAGSIQEFWQRWHRRGPLRTYLNLLATMVIGGFWHGANWTFLLWGAWHGGLLALHRGWAGRLPWNLGNPLLMLGVVIGWVTFRAPSIAGTWAMYRGMLGLNGAGFSDALLWQVTPDQWWCLGLAGGLVYAPALRCGRVPDGGGAGCRRHRAPARLRHRHRRALQPRRGALPVLPVLRRRWTNPGPVPPAPMPWRCSPCSAGAPGRGARRSARGRPGRGSPRL
ncbi:MBOAT family protein [Dankookia rubra]|uniref:MBOAT family protein n=1 Tax=Dankookia rubra TaxID=1442381 RepID=UPI0019D649DF|nr:MBOAT family protein [Dankookia rubra]